MVAGCRFPRNGPLRYASGIPLAREVIAPARNRYAVLVGINYYDEPSSKLGGCINDAINQKRVLTENFEFDERNIKMLTDEPGNK